MLAEPLFAGELEGQQFAGKMQHRSRRALAGRSDRERGSSSELRVDSWDRAPYARTSMFRAVFALLVLLAASPVWAAGGSPTRLKAIVPAGPPAAILPLADVRPGMVGQALTVFS